MVFDALDNITETEESCKAKKAAAEVDARRLIQQAEQDGNALLQQIRADAELSGKNMLCQAQKRALEKAETIRKDTDASVAAMISEAAAKLDQAAELIVERIVNV